MASGTKTVIEAQNQICVDLRPSAVKSARGAFLRSFLTDIALADVCGGYSS